MKRVLICAVFLAGSSCNLFGAVEEPPIDMGISADSELPDGSAPDAGDVDGGDVTDAGCMPEPADDFCFRLGKNCGVLSGEDLCGTTREIDCGSCADGCGQFEDNVCGCPCEIDGECYIDGEPNPDSPCEVCSPSDSDSDWTVVVGAACDDGNACSAESQCNPAGNCAPIDFAGCEEMSTECAASVCDEASMSCVVTPEADGIDCTDDGLACTTDVCMAGVCAHVPDDGTCVIDGACYVAGDPNPGNECEQCDPTVSATDWTPLSAGSMCADGMGQACTSGQCDGMGACDVVLTPGNCFIDNACYADGDAEPGNPCNVCDSSASTAAWTAAAMGTICADGDGIPCTSGQCDGSGACVPQRDPGTCLIAGNCYNDGQDDPANECQQCQTAINGNQFSPKGDGTSCASDFACTSGACQAGQCQQQVVTGCLIDSACYAADDVNPANSCEVCDPAGSATAWTVLSDGDACGSGSCSCTAGACLKTNGTACGA